jgi:iron-sulfur cluster repair protein YtfE (RIC family)
MRPSEIRARVLADHENLRASLVDLEALAFAVERPRPGRTRVSKLRTESEAFLDRLARHMRWEEAYMIPALFEADSWGPQRVERLIEDHREQRELLALILDRVRDANRPDAVVARDIRALVGLLREDMREEDAEFLDDRVLRDDIVGIDVVAG